jgi:hypothetical protein
MTSDYPLNTSPQRMRGDMQPLTNPICEHVCGYFGVQGAEFYLDHLSLVFGSTYNYQEQEEGGTKKQKEK